jgi:porphobilinogen synthase
MPGQCQLSVDRAVKECREIASLGIPAVILFGIPEEKDPLATGAYAEDGIVQRALRAIRDAVPDLCLIADVCLCEYSSHGHCGVIEDGRLVNDASLELLARSAVSLARSGADVVAPSAMMDGQVIAIRRALDETGLETTALMSYAAKYASSFYGPFRDAAESAPAFGDRRGYQMAPPNRREALLEVARDVEEGADIVMVKPALAYLDVVRDVRDRFDVPVAAYNVSGEYAMIKAASANGWVVEDAIVLEVLTAMRRAGADCILTYFAKDVAARL